MEHTEQTIRAYDQNEQTFQDKFASYDTYIKKMSVFANGFVENGANILDLGCGPGNSITTILKRNPDCTFTGVDLSENFLKRARKRFPQFTFIQKNILDIPLDIKYDVVVASFCIVHLTDEETEKLLSRISKVLKENGTLYLSYMSGSGQGFESTSFAKDPIFFNYYDNEFIVNLLAENQLKVAQISKEEYREQDGSITIDTFIYSRKKE